LRVQRLDLSDYGLGQYDIGAREFGVYGGLGFRACAPSKQTSDALLGEDGLVSVDEVLVVPRP